MSKTVQLSHIA